MLLTYLETSVQRDIADKEVREYLWRTMCIGKDRLHVRVPGGKIFFIGKQEGKAVMLMEKLSYN